MKNFLILETPESIFNYVGNLWRSDIFKESHNNPNGYIHKIIHTFSQTPRLFFDMHIESMEMVHFSSWFHAIQLRPHYDNDILHDLYYHHEFFHLITMTYHNQFSFNEWESKMKTNEFWASLESEVLIYFYLPELRSQSFKEEIWADTFLNDPNNHDLYGKFFDLKNDASEKILLRIAHARNQCEFFPITPLDHQIFDYTISSRRWAEIWQQEDAWNNVETHMYHYLNQVQLDPNLAILSHLSWLENLQSQDSHNIAFGTQARAYTAVHRSLFKSAYQPEN